MVQLGVGAPGGEQVGMRPRLDDASVVDHVDDVGRLDRRQTMGHRQRRPTGDQLAQRLLDPTLRRGVESGCRLVEDEHPRVREQHPGDRDPLTLPTRQSEAPLADHGLVPVRELDDAVVDGSVARRSFDVRVGGVGSSVRDVVAQGAGEQVRLLGDEADGGGE